MVVVAVGRRMEGGARIGRAVEKKWRRSGVEGGGWGEAEGAGSESLVNGIS